MVCGEFLAEVDGESAGFFAVDVLAGVGGQDGGGAVPAVAGGDQEGVDIGAGEQFLEVVVGLCSR